MILAQRPFAGVTEGASLYIGTPGAADIRYRRTKVMSPSSPFWPLTTTDTIDPGAASVPKCQAVAQVTDPTEQLTYSIPPAQFGQPIAFQVRTFWNDYENETIYRPVLTKTDGSGNQDDKILGAAVISPPIKMDAGGMSLTFRYIPSRSGIQPTQFALVQTSGPGSLADTVIGAAEGLNTAEIDGLANGQTYGWRLEARNGSVLANLGAVVFTADADGPDGITSFAILPD